MIFRKSEIDKVLAAEARDRKDLETAESERKSLIPRWMKAQAKAEIVSARIGGYTGTYAGGIGAPGAGARQGFDEDLFRLRDEQLTAELRAAIAERDGILGDFIIRARTVRARLEARRSIFYDGFNSWLGTALESRPKFYTSPGCAPGQVPPDPVKAELLRIQMELQGLKNAALAEIIKLIEEANQWFEGLEHDSYTAPMLRLNEFCRMANELDAAA